MNYESAADAERSEQIRLLQDSATAFASGRLPIKRSRELRGKQPEFDRAMYEELAGQGWAGLLIAEEFGGFGLGLAETRVVIEALAGQLVTEPVVPVAVLASGVVSRCEPSAQRDALLGLLAQGKAIAATAWQGSAGNLDPTPTPFVARRDADSWILNGEARFVRPGSGATHCLLLADAEGSLAAFVVDAGHAGLDTSVEEQADGTGLARMVARQARVASTDMLKLSEDSLSAAINQAILMNAVELLALISRMRSMTTEYIKTRVQFGRPVGSFQALQHRCVDMLIHEEITRAVVTQAVDILDRSEDAHQHASMVSRAKARAAETALMIARESIQMHGGIAVTDEYDLSLYVNRTLALVPWLGNAQQHRRRYMQLNPLSRESETA